MKTWKCPVCKQEQQVRTRILPDGTEQEIRSSCAYCGYKTGKYRRYKATLKEKNGRVIMEVVKVRR